MLSINPNLQIPEDEFRFRYSRSSGPGGQNVNKVNTKVSLHWAVRTSPSLPESVRRRFCAKYHGRINKEGELVLHSQRFRDQSRNIADCLEKLREMLEESARVPKVRKKVKPSKASKERRLKAKKQLSQRKQGRRPPSVD